MSFDFSDYINAAEERLIETLRGYASLDSDFENPTFVKGFPDIKIAADLIRPLIAVYVYNSEISDTGYDNVVDGNGLPLSDLNWEITTGVEASLDLYVDVCTQRGTANAPVLTGGATVGKRIAGKVASRLALNPECLGEALELSSRGPIVQGPLEPRDSRDQPFILYRVDVNLTLCVTEVINNAVLTG